MSSIQMADRDIKLAACFGASPEVLRLSNAGLRLWRGMRTPTPNCDLGSLGSSGTAKRRIPLAMPETLMVTVDDFFQEKFSWRSRSENTLFITGNKRQARFHGEPCSVFPIELVQFVWSPNIPDLSVALHKLCAERLPPHELHDWLDGQGYCDTDLLGAIHSGNEVMIRTERYLWSRPDDPFFKLTPDENDSIQSIVQTAIDLPSGGWYRREVWDDDGISGESLVFRFEDVAAMSRDSVLGLALFLTKGACAKHTSIVYAGSFVFVNWPRSQPDSQHLYDPS